MNLAGCVEPMGRSRNAYRILVWKRGRGGRLGDVDAILKFVRVRIRTVDGFFCKHDN